MTEHPYINTSNEEDPAIRWKIEAQHPISFVVRFSKGLLEPLNGDLIEIGVQGKGAKRMTVVDKTVYQLYGKAIEGYFRARSINCKIVVIEAHEEKKSLDTLLYILGEMEAFKLERAGMPVLAIGGGVLLDVVGQAASMYRRGVPYIRVPTTLLGIVDASIGVKTGINHFGRRNRLGSYFAPVGVYLDPLFLKTLPEKELSNGCGEILKVAVARDRKLFELLEKEGSYSIRDKFQDEDASKEILQRSIYGMIKEIAPDLWEKDMKRMMNLGHSFSPLIEMNALPELSHGEAVAEDVLFSCLLSSNRGLMQKEEVKRVFKVAVALGLPTYHPLYADIGMLEESLADAKRHRDGALELPLPLAIGRGSFFNDIRREELTAASREMREMSAVYPPPQA